MFDGRNKGQPKLVYSRVPQKDALKTDQQPLPTASNFQASLSKPNDPQAPQPEANTSLGSSKRNEGQRQLSVLNDMQKDREQSKSSQQTSHVQKQQQQHVEMRPKKQQQHHVEMRPKTQQHQPNITVLDVVSTKKQQTTKGVELYKIAVSDTGGANTPMENIKHESYGEVKVHRSKEYEGINEKRPVLESLQTSSSSSIQGANNEKKYVVSTAGMRSENVKHMSTSDSNNANFLRHPRTHSDSTVTPQRPLLSPQSPNQYLAPQFTYYPQHHPPKQHQEKHVDVPSQHQDRRLRPEVVRVRSYSAGRQPMPTTLHSTSYKSVNPGQTWSIPRVSTAPRPHSLNVPYTKHDNGGSRSPTADLEFSNYDPSASPRALRSHGRPHSEITTRQLSAPNSSSSFNSSSNAPKSILKATANQDQPEVFFSSRPLLLPRAHSEKTNTYTPRDFDFSSILTTNNDILSGKVPTIQITSHTPEHTTPGNPRQPLQRPLSASAGIANHDLQPDGRPIRKSVTFNSLVRLHHEDYPSSTLRSLSADA